MYVDFRLFSPNKKQFFIPKLNFINKKNVFVGWRRSVANPTSEANLHIKKRRYLSLLITVSYRKKVNVFQELRLKRQIILTCIPESIILWRL